MSDHTALKYILPIEDFGTLLIEGLKRLLVENPERLLMILRVSKDINFLCRRPPKSSQIIFS